MSGTDPFRFDDAAYVLGALPEPDRARFEEHLAGCAACTGRVAELWGWSTALPEPGTAQDGLADLAADAPPLPPTVLSGLLTRAVRARRRRFAVVGGLAAVAAACVTALVIALWPAGSAPRPAPAQAMTALVATPLRATAALTGTAWGTRVDLECRYPAGAAPGYAYGLVVVDRAGHEQQLGSWTVGAGGDVRYASGTSWPRDRISAVEITYSGRPVLRLALD